MELLTYWILMMRRFITPVVVLCLIQPMYLHSQILQVLLIIPSRRFGQTIAVPGTNLDFINGGTSCFFLEYDTTYFWLTYDIKPSATSGNFVDADLRGSAVGGSAAACPSPIGTSTSLEPSAGGFSCRVQVRLTCSIVLVHTIPVLPD
jgi:hypothetical protein